MTSVANSNAPIFNYFPPSIWILKLSTVCVCRCVRWFLNIFWHFKFELVGTYNNGNGTEATHQHHTNTKQLTSPYNHNAHNSCAKAKGKNGCFIAPSMNSLLCLDHAGVVAIFSTGAKSPAPTTVVQRVRALLPSNGRGRLHVNVLLVPLPSSQCKLAVNVDFILLLLWRSNITTPHCLSVHILTILFLVAATAPRFSSDGLGRLHISVLFAPLLSYCNNVSLLTAVILVFGGDQILQHRTVCPFIS